MRSGPDRARLAAEIVAFHYQLQGEYS
jgi:hypothetical protein